MIANALNPRRSTGVSRMTEDQRILLNLAWGLCHALSDMIQELAHSTSDARALVPSWDAALRAHEAFVAFAVAKEDAMPEIPDEETARVVKEWSLR